MNFEQFLWMNESNVVIKENEVALFAPGGTDFFNTPVLEDGEMMQSQTNAPFFYQEIEGDFVIRALLNPTHKTLFDAAGLMIFQNTELWVKVGYERTESDIRRLLSVVTNPFSDDANGPILEVSAVWVQVARKGNTLAIHYSLDGEGYDMLRVCYLPFQRTLKVGLCGQCTTGEGVNQVFQNVSLEKRTLEDIWTGK